MSWYKTPFNPYDPQALRPPEGRLVLTATTRENNSQIFAVNADGTCEMRLTNSGAFDSGAVWSSQGARIAFESNRTGSWNLFSMDGYGKDLRQLTHLETAWPGGLSWSPDDRRIVFSYKSSVEGLHALYIISAGGGRQRLLLDDPAASLGGPAWSPRGDQILFTSSVEGEPSRIELIRPDGSGRRVLASHEEMSYGAPDWSPDGSTIVFTASGNSPRFGDVGSDIYLMDADGANIRPVAELPTPGGGPFWSPDGQHIAFSAHRYCEDRDFQVYIMNADGSGISRPYHYEWGAAGGDWGPVYFVWGQGLVPQGRVIPLG